MIKNCYFRCKTCGEIITKYIDNKYASDIMSKLVCDNCGDNKFEITTENKISQVKLNKNKVRDNRSINKEKYMSQSYKDIRQEINRVHKERKGLLGERRIYA